MNQTIPKSWKRKFTGYQTIFSFVVTCHLLYNENYFVGVLMAINCFLSFRLWYSFLPETKREKLYHYTDWLKIRDKWFRQKQIELSCKVFRCVCCGNSNLDPFTKIQKNLATIDHIQPVSKFPELWNVESNFQIMCYPCNQKKGNRVAKTP